MPAPVSKKQARYMHAILSGKPGQSARGDRVPKSVAGKYTGGSTKDLPESKGKAHDGGVWGKEHHAKAKKKVEQVRTEKKKKKAESRSEKVKKSFENYYHGRGAGTIVVDDKNRILIGKRNDDKLWATPGGLVEPDETFEDGALRELKEEANIVGRAPQLILEGYHKGNKTQQFVVRDYKGKVKGNGELTQLKFVHPDELPLDRMRWECREGIEAFLTSKMRKSLREMVAIEELQKNIIRDAGRGQAVFEMSHGDALKLVGNGTFRFLRTITKDMKPEDFRDVKFDVYTISIRKHLNDVYSGRISDGHKIVHQFTNRSLPQMAAELMSVFEWYMPEDEPDLELLDEDSLPDDAIEGGMKELIANYKRHNIADIYDEMENIRSEIRNGAAVDLQQVEARIMRLFDKLEATLHEVGVKHNQLASRAGSDIDELEARLMQLQSKVDDLSKKPVTVEAVSSNPQNPSKLLNDEYCYLSRPQIEISPNGKIRIVFSDDWNHMDQENFLTDMRAKVVKKSRG